MECGVGSERGVRGHLERLARQDGRSFENTSYISKVKAKDSAFLRYYSPYADEAGYGFVEAIALDVYLRADRLSMLTPYSTVTESHESSGVTRCSLH